MEQEWIEPGLTLLLLCEEGEEEYPEEYLKEKNMAVLKIEEFDQLNTVFFKNCERNYHPAQIIIEYNGMWKLEDLLSIRYPRSFELQGVYSTVNGTTLDMYLMNMRNMLMEQLTESELIVVNRCADGVNRSGFRRALKVQNPMAQLIFEDMQGKIIEPSEEDLPYDINADVIEIKPADYGIWYIDCMDQPERYKGKTVEFTAMVLKSPKFPKGQFVPGRMAMTCCEADMTFLGFMCKWKDAEKYKTKEWVKVRAKVGVEYQRDYHGEGPVLYAENVEKAAEIKDIVQF